MYNKNNKGIFFFLKNKGEVKKYKKNQTNPEYLIEPNIILFAMLK